MIRSLDDCSLLISASARDKHTNPSDSCQRVSSLLGSLVGRYPEWDDSQTVVRLVGKQSKVAQAHKALAMGSVLHAKYPGYQHELHRDISIESD